MIPLHSLPMGCVCNFLQYKSCIIHAYRRATSINYVSLLGACVFTTSSFSFYSSSLSSSSSLSRSSLNHSSDEDVLALFFSLVSRFTGVKWTEPKFQRETDERENSGEKEKVCSGAVM